MSGPAGTGPVRIANCSGFYGDRLSAAQEMVEGGPIDVLTGDWLAELTMLILAKNRMRDPKGGYAKTFVAQMEQVMGSCLDAGIKVVSNAGGLDPAGCAEAVLDVAQRIGLHPRVAYVEGDDLIGRLEDLREMGVDLAHMETGMPLGDVHVVSANAYLGGRGIAEALARGADIVVTGRVTDAALVVGPSIWWHGWGHDSWDALGGAVVAGHVIECGAQATGGNYSFFGEIPGLDHPGFPIAEVGADGSSVITKHPGHGGQVCLGTVTAQLLYEIAGPAYPNPDVTAHFDTICLSEVGSDRVRISGVRGSAPPDLAKVSLNYMGGWKTTATFMLTGLDIEEKAALAERGLWELVPGGKAAFAEVDVTLLRREHEDPSSNEAAMAELRITVKDEDEHKVGRALTSRMTELALASYPGFFVGPVTTQAYGVFWPALVPAELIGQEVVLEGERWLVQEVVRSTADGRSDPLVEAPAPISKAGSTPGEANSTHGETELAREREQVQRVPIGRITGARSGDKGGNANLGIWARSDAGYEWLAAELTVERLRQLIPEAANLPVIRYELANLRALNFVITGLLGEGVASSTRLDGQAKSLGEYFRAKVVEVPVSLLGGEARDAVGSLGG